MKPQITVLLVAVAAVTCEQTNQESVKHGGQFSSFQHSSHLCPPRPHGFNSKFSSPQALLTSTLKRRHHQVQAPEDHPPADHTVTPGSLHHPTRVSLHPTSTKQSYPPFPIHPVSKNTPSYGPSLSMKPILDPTSYSESGHSRPNIPGYSHHFKPTPKIPSRHHPSPHAASYDEIPKCASNTSSPWCLEDNDYPTYEVQEAAQKNSIHLLKLYADAADTNTANSADGPDALGKETHLCTSHSSYVRPLRAMNVDGDWRVIVNVIKVNYEDLTQTVRLEECEEVGQSCPLVPKCYASTCIQTFIYHRFLVYDPSDIYFPFTIESFKLPASCSCILDSFYVE